MLVILFPVVWGWIQFFYFFCIFSWRITRIDHFSIPNSNLVTILFISLCFFQDREIKQCQNEILEQKKEIDSLKIQLGESTRIIKSLKQELEQYTGKKGKQENGKERYFFLFYWFRYFFDSVWINWTLNLWILTLSLLVVCYVQK